MSLTREELEARINRTKELANQCIIEVDEAKLAIAELEKAIALFDRTH